jgi:hypothetical protein
MDIGKPETCCGSTRFLDYAADLIAEARAVDWDFAQWCYVSGHDASDSDARNMFECLLAYASSEGGANLH